MAKETPVQALTRHEFYKLAHECREFAHRLATHDQDSVDRAMCGEYNAFLPRVRSYDRLREPLSRLRPARPISRLMVLTWLIAGWMVLVLLGRQLPRPAYLLLLSLAPFLIMSLFLVPQSLYGTTIEAIEGHLLVVVQTLQQILHSGEMDFTEAVYFVLRDVLQETADDLRQQVYLNRMDKR
jgi:hypothetical protein